MPPFGEDSRTMVGERAALCQFEPESTALCALSFDVRGDISLFACTYESRGIALRLLCLKTPGMCIELVMSVRVGVRIGLGV